MLRFVETKITPEEVASYHERGYLIYGPLIAGDSLTKLQAEVDRLWADAGKQYSEGASWLANSLLNGVHANSEPLREVFYRGPLVDWMTELIGPNVKAASNQLTVKQPRDRAAFAWHQDNGYGTLVPENAVSCWLALDDVDEANGCLWIIPGSHRRGLVSHGTGKPGEKVAEVEEMGEGVPVRLAAGECVLFHGDTLHMSRGNATDRMRRAYFFRYADADAVEVRSGRPRVGKLLRGVSRFREVTECSDLVCHPEAAPALPPQVETPAVG